MKDLQTKIKQFWQSEETEKKIRQILTDFELSEQEEVIKDMIKQVIENKISKDELAYELKEALNVDFDLAMNLSLKVQMELFNDIEQELDQMAEITEIAGGSENVSELSDLDAFIESIINDINISDIDDNLRRRFRKMCESYLRGLRDEFELKEVLQKIQATGGMELSESSATFVAERLKLKKDELLKENIDISALLKEISQIKEKVEIEELDIDVKAKVEEPEEEQMLTYKELTGEKTIKDLLSENGTEILYAEKETEDKPEDQQAITQEKDEPESFAEEIEKTEELLDATPELAPPAPMVVEQETPAKQPEPIHVSEPESAPESPVKESAVSNDITKSVSEKTQITVKEHPVDKPVAVHESPNPNIIRSSSDNGRPKVEDVKFVPKLFGPIDELAQLDLSNYRRLADDPQRACQKIMDKLDLLEDDSMEKRVQGINALKQSPLYNLYSKVITESFSTGSAFNQVIDAGGGLKLDEFKAIMDLNKKITA